MSFFLPYRRELTGSADGDKTRSLAFNGVIDRKNKPSRTCKVFQMGGSVLTSLLNVISRKFHQFLSMIYDILVRLLAIGNSSVSIFDIINKYLTTKFIFINNRYIFLINLLSFST
ncbi:hypothetical protein CHUAL_001319 [Chamberlinius hualienensis]